MIDDGMIPRLPFAISPVTDNDVPRPFWSVIIPTYQPEEKYLRQTLESILQQDPGPNEMQIVVLDDCSPNGAPEEIVRRLAGRRIFVHKEQTNCGLATIWNRCIQHSHGYWVHILHQDDLVYPGFYEAMRSGVERSPEIGAAFCRHEFIDKDGHTLGISDLESAEAAILENWISRIGVVQRIQTPSIVVKRATYERCGGYLPALTYTLDWEMWQRIAIHFPVWYEPHTLAAYRMHDNSATGRLQRSCNDLWDCCRAIKITERYLPTDVVKEVALKRRRIYRQRAADRATGAARRGIASVTIQALCVLLWLKPDVSGLAKVATTVSWLAVGVIKRIARRIARR